MKNVKINRKDKLYVINEAGRYSCLGFQVCKDRTTALQNELHRLFNRPIDPLPRAGSQALYRLYLEVLEYARQKHQATGWRSETGLTKRLIGLEGKRVEVIHNGEARRFNVGRSTGWIPCHLEIFNSRSLGGDAAYVTEEDELRIVR